MLRPRFGILLFIKVIKNVDSPKNKYIIDGKNDLISISPKGTKSIELNSRDLDSIIEKSKARKSKLYLNDRRERRF